jgi:hypothetical protein
MKTATYLMLGMVALGLSACGGRETLKPLKDDRLPAVPRGADAAPTAAELMQPSIQARPQRNVELLLQSQKRDDDTFDLPPERNPQ